MKVRIGFSPGRSANTMESFVDLVAILDQLAFDSIWLSEVLTGPGIDPLVGLSYAAARSSKLKLGTTMLLPGRNVVRLAKALATLDRLSDGRALITFVPGLIESPEREAIGLEPRRRGAAMEESIPLLRRLLEGPIDAFEGEFSSLCAMETGLFPTQRPLEFWLGGSAPKALERCGRFGDGWLPSLCTAKEALEGKVIIEQVATREGRSISPEHFGVSIPYRMNDDTPISAPTSPRAQRSAALVPVGMAALRATLGRFIDAGFSKFVLRPVTTVRSWHDELSRLKDGVGDLER